MVGFESTGISEEGTRGCGRGGSRRGPAMHVAQEQRREADEKSALRSGKPPDKTPLFNGSRLVREPGVPLRHRLRTSRVTSRPIPNMSSMRCRSISSGQGRRWRRC